MKYVTTSSVNLIAAGVNLGTLMLWSVTGPVPNPSLDKIFSMKENEAAMLVVNVLFTTNIFNNLFFFNDMVQRYPTILIYRDCSALHFVNPDLELNLNSIAAISLIILWCQNL